jgi:hypothetical protein
MVTRRDAERRCNDLASYFAKVNKEGLPGGHVRVEHITLTPAGTPIGCGFDARTGASGTDPRSVVSASGSGAVGPWWFRRPAIQQGASRSTCRADGQGPAARGGGHAMHLCDHDPCTCETAPDGEYCSPHCREHGRGVGLGPCGCGHPLCVAPIEDPLGSVAGSSDPGPR